MSGMNGFDVTGDIVPLVMNRGTIRGVLVGSRRNFEEPNRVLERILPSAWLDSSTGRVRSPIPRDG